MATWGFGLRAKSMMALFVVCLLTLLPAGLIGWQVVESVRNHFGEAYARNYTQLKREQILAPVSRELTLARRLAGSEVTRQWLLDEQNPQKKALMFKEAESYRRDFRDHAYFIASAVSRHFFFNDAEKPYSEAPRYTLDRNKESDFWFFNSVANTPDYNINVNYDIPLQVTMVWLNVSIRDGARNIGVAGAGLNLNGFLKAFIGTDEPGVTPLIVNHNGAIQAHRNVDLIAINQAGSTARAEQTLAGQLPLAADREALSRAMVDATANPGQVYTLWARLDGRKQLIALSHIPELDWFAVTAVDLRVAKVLDEAWLSTGLIAIVALLVVLLTAFSFAVSRLVLKPLEKLHHSAAAISRGDFDVVLPEERLDEIGDLGRAFRTMVNQVRAYTRNLESKISERTRELEAANREMQAAHQKINDSIDYASLIQKAILPHQQLSSQLGERHFVLWHPRDVVGGDFYVFRHDGPNYLLGVVDCAGHGVPGALMTMLARAAIDHAMNQEGIASPAALLTQTDRAMRAMLQDCPLPRAIATNMDAGLAYVDLAARRMVYAGARIPLYWSDGEEVGCVQGLRRAIGDRRQGIYADSEIELKPGVTYYLVTDGYLDQAGGELGYGFGNSRFSELLRQVARQPMAEQANRLERHLREYQGDYSQRDDVTILSFRFD